MRQGEPIDALRDYPVYLIDNVTGDGAPNLAFGAGEVLVLIPGVVGWQDTFGVATYAVITEDVGANQGKGNYTIRFTRAALANVGKIKIKIKKAGIVTWDDSIEVNPILDVIRTDVAQAGGASTIRLDAGASGVLDFYVGKVARVVAGAGAGQEGYITAYAGTTTKDATVSPAWTTQPDGTSVFEIRHAGKLSPGAIAAAQFQANAIIGSVLDSTAVTKIAGGVLEETVATHANVAGSLAAYLMDVAGAVGFNSILDGGQGQAAPSYDGGGLMLTGRVRIFPDKATCDAATLGGGVEGAIRVITISTTAVSPGLASIYRSSAA